MKVYSFGAESAPVIMLLPGTCCDWRSFEHVVPLLERDYRVLVVSYDGFDESERTEFTPLPDKIDVPGTEIHIFYALKMGEKYRERYMCHFAHPVIHEHDLQHEELQVRYPDKWAQLVKSIVH